jgi:hypothetical protein
MFFFFSVELKHGFLFTSGEVLFKVGTTLDCLHPMSRADHTIVSNFQPPASLFIDVGRLALQGPFHGSVRSVGEREKPANIITTINTTN